MLGTTQLVKTGTSVQTRVSDLWAGALEHWSLMVTRMLVQNEFAATCGATVEAKTIISKASFVCSMATGLSFFLQAEALGEPRQHTGIQVRGRGRAEGALHLDINEI